LPLSGDIPVRAWIAAWLALAATAWTSAMLHADIMPGAIALLPPGPWTLAQFVDIARQRHPELAAASAPVEQARGRYVQVGLCPNPTFGPQINDFGDNEHQAGDTGFQVTQEFVTCGKLRKARAAAWHQITAADRAAVSKWFDVLTQVRAAYVEALTARRQVETTDSLVAIAEKSADAAQHLFKTGVGSQPDVLRAQVELEQTRVQRQNAASRANVAWTRLALAAGLADMPPFELAGTLPTELPRFAFAQLRDETMTRSSILQEASERIQQAQKTVIHAEALKYPNVQVQAAPEYSHPDRDTRMDVLVRVELPIFNRNQGNIYAAQGQVMQAVADADKLRLQLSDRLADAHRRYEIARDKAIGFRERILPNARESVRLVRIGYESGDPKYSYTTLLQSQQVLFQAELLHIEALGEAWRTAAEIYGLVQAEEPFLDD
jgi:cobalt-zinc-cadmium efflux system outer membrane protein